MRNANTLQRRIRLYLRPIIHSMKFRLFFLVVLVFIGCTAISTTSSTKETTDNLPRRPKLIVGITVDQMRYDYIERYWNDYGSGGFKRLVGEGFFCRNVQFNYMPTYTGPGHASIFTGTTPSFHGIIQNDWYERTTGAMMYCSADTTVQGVGTAAKGGLRDSPCKP